MRKLLLFAFVAFSSLSSYGQSSGYVIYTVAGGIGSGTATNVGMTPYGTVVDAAGNLYLSDNVNHVVRKINSAGISTIIAGTGAAGLSGDNGPATAAQLNGPYGLALDAAGNLYIADVFNHRIRKIAAGTNIITTVAGTSSGNTGDGGLATAAKLSQPSGVALDTAGNIYIADLNNHRIRKVTASTGIITTIAGTTQGLSGDGGLATLAQLKKPTAVAVDTPGNVYIADYSNFRIRKIDAATGNISTIAGTTNGFGGDGGLATAANLSSPSGVALDASGNIYISDLLNNRIRKITAGTGIISTIAGISGNGYSGDGGQATAAQVGTPKSIAVDPAGNLLITDNNNNRVRKIASSTGIITTVAGNGSQFYGGDGGAPLSAQLQLPAAAISDPSGNVYISDGNNHIIRRITGGTITTIAGTPGVAGASGDGGQATAAQMNGMGGIAKDAAGNIYIADINNNKIRKINSSGVITTIAGTGVAGYSGDNGPATSAQLKTPYDLALDTAGNIYVADYGNNVIRKIDATTNVITTIAGTGAKLFSGDGGAATLAKFNNPAGVAVDIAGNVYIADNGNHVIRKVTYATGIVNTIAGIGTQSGSTGDGGLATAAKLKNPMSVKLDTAGNMYIADNGNHKIRKIDVATGNINTIAGNGNPGFSGDAGLATSAQLNGPVGISIDNAGKIYVADVANNRVRSLLQAVTPTISITASQTNVCTGTPVTFTATTTNSGTTPLYQWKVNNNNAGTNSNTFTYTPANGDIVTCLLTNNDLNALPATVTSNSVTISITTSVTPTISIAPSQNNICAGTSVTYTATPTNGGSTPAYQWKVNGLTVGSNSTTYSYNPANGDAVTCVLTSNAVCASTSTATSNSVNMNVTPTVTPSISVAASQNSICSGASVTYTATPTNGGTTPSYQWQVNGNNVGTNSSTYSYMPSFGDAVTCVLTNNAICATHVTDTSSSITVSVTPTVTPVVTISESQNNICAGTSVTYTALPINGGTTPAYQWQVNGNNIGTNTDTFSYTPASGDVVKCVLTTNASCASVPTDTSSAVTMVVNSIMAPTVTVTSNPGTTLNNGEQIIFTANTANAGANPSYQWRKNGTDISGATQSTYTAIAGTSILNFDQVTVWVKNNDACGDTSSSNAQTIVVTTTGVNEVSNKNNSLNLFPNPNDGSFIVKAELTDKAQSTVALEVYNTIGQTIYKEEVAVTNGKLEHKVALPNALPSGNYFLKLSAGGNNSIIRFNVAGK